MKRRTLAFDDEEALREQLYRGPGGLLTLDLTDHGLQVLPDAVLEITELECLILNNNKLKNLPEGIG